MTGHHRRPAAARVVLVAPWVSRADAPDPGRLAVEHDNELHLAKTLEGLVVRIVNTVEDGAGQITVGDSAQC